MASYTQLKDGTWGIRVRGQAAAGDVVTVTKKDGTEQEETIHQVLWTGPDKYSDGTVSLCRIEAKARHPSSRSSRKECPECGDFVDAGTRCWETGMEH